MKQDTIQALLAKRAAGTLTDEELATLNTLTRRDEVVAGAEKRAAVIRHRRQRVVAMAVALVAIVAMGVTLLMPRPEPQLMAKQATAVEQPMPEEIEATPVETVPMQTAAVDVVKTAAAPAAAVKVKQMPKAEQNDEPVVMCNNKCDADSVISDIWKFLTA